MMPFGFVLAIVLWCCAWLEFGFFAGSVRSGDPLPQRNAFLMNALILAAFAYLTMATALGTK